MYQSLLSPQGPYVQTKLQNILFWNHCFWDVTKYLKWVFQLGLLFELCTVYSTNHNRNHLRINESTKWHVYRKRKYAFTTSNGFFKKLRWVWGVFGFIKPQIQKNITVVTHTISHQCLGLWRGCLPLHQSKFSHSHKHVTRAVNKSWHFQSNQVLIPSLGSDHLTMLTYTMSYRQKKLPILPEIEWAPGQKLEKCCASG